MVKKLDDMNLIDDFLFWTLLSDEEYGPEVAKYLLETILRRTVRTVKVHPQRTIYGEDKDLSSNDGAFTIYLNIGGIQDGMPEDLVNLLRYMKNSNRENAIGEPLTEIQKMVEEVKQRKGVRKAYMKFCEYVKYETDEARKKGWEEGLEKGWEEGLTKGREEGREEGLEKGLKEGREEERQNTLREKQRADLAQQRIKELEKEIERLKKA